jgi:aspartyl-tRNA(Asn)/glutamyl-tRNA(Gln) amidotransferase subunit A
LTPAEILALGALPLARAIAAGKVTAVAAMEATLERAKAVQPRLNCMIRIDEKDALAAARLADRDLARGYLRGPLHGVPMAHKDMYYRRGVVSTCGSKIRRDTPASTTATALLRLDSAGALQFGVLNMAEFAYGPTGHNYHFGHCRNPWDRERVTGGSSSGSGASVAARANFAALGSDTGGSIRLPAAFCGVTGMKPTYARVSRAGAMPLSFSMDTVGPLARSAEDCAVILAAIAGADPADPTASTRPVPDYLAQLERPIAGLRIATARRYFYDDMDPEVEAILHASLEQFRRLGAHVVEVEVPDLHHWNLATGTIISSEAAAAHGEWLRTRAQDYSEQVRARLSPGLEIPAHQYIDTLRLRARALRQFSEAAFAQADVFHAPVVAFQTPTIAETDVGGGASMAGALGRITRLTRPINYLGVPALTLPAGFTKAGMPIGMQLLGRAFDEAATLRAGHAFQRATDWHLRAPELQ